MLQALQQRFIRQVRLTRDQSKVRVDPLECSRIYTVLRHSTSDESVLCVIQCKSIVSEAWFPSLGEELPNRDEPMVNIGYVVYVLQFTVRFFAIYVGGKFEGTRAKCLDCNKTGRWPALFLTLTLHLWRSLHYFTLLYITLHYLGHFSLHYSTCVRFMVAGCDLFVTPPLWHPASVAVRSLS